MPSQAICVWQEHLLETGCWINLWTAMITCTVERRAQLFQHFQASSALPFNIGAGFKSLGGLDSCVFPAQHESIKAALIDQKPEQWDQLDLPQNTWLQSSNHECC